MFLHVFMSQGPEGEICVESSSLGCEGLVEFCDPGLFAGQEICNDLGAVFGYVSSEVCSSCGVRPTGTRIHVITKVFTKRDFFLP